MEPGEALGTVIAGLDPAIHASAISTRFDLTAWMPGSSPGMTKRRKEEERREEGGRE
jgi:hypothetical protein